MGRINQRPWETDQIFGRILFISAAFHNAATLISIFVLFVMTRGGGDGYPDSPSIRAVATATQWLAMPLAWGVERFIDLDIANHLLPFLAFVALRILNSLVIGAAIAWVWVLIWKRRTHSNSKGKE